MGIKVGGRVALVVALVAGALVGAGRASSASGAGGELVEEALPHEVGDNAQLRLDSVDAFATGGGRAVLEPATPNEEAFWYERVDVETNRLIGLTRPDAQSHAVGSFVGAADSPTPAATASPPSEPTSEPDATESPASDASSGSSGGSFGDEQPQGSASSAGAIPRPCEITNTCHIVPPIDCSGCDTLVEDVLGLIELDCETTRCAGSTIDEISDRIHVTCGPAGLLGCEPEVVRVIIGIINVYCPSGLTTCADPTIDLVTDIIMDFVCPSGSIGYCAAELNREVNEQLEFVVATARGLVAGSCGNDTADACVNKVLDMLEATGLPIVCRFSDPFTCVDKTLRLVNDLVASACSLGSSPSGRDGVTECAYRVLTTVQLVLRVVDDTMIIACQSTQVNTCLSNLLLKINLEIDRTCASVPGTSYSTGLNNCVEKVLQIVNAVVEAAKVLMRQACGSDDPIACADKVIADLLVQIETIHDTVANICKGYLSTSSTTDSAASNCINKVLETVDLTRQLVTQTGNDAMIIACGSADANVCLANTLSKVNLQITETCGLLPGTAYSDGTNRCVDKLLDIVNGLLAAAKAQMVQVCGSSEALPCANKILADVMVQMETIHDTVANICRGHLSTSSTADSAATNCVVKALETVQLVVKTGNDAMIIACGSADANVCLANTLSKVNLQITETCGLLPGTAYSDGTNRCVDKLLDIVNGLLAAAKAQMVQVCGSSEALPCANKILADVMVQMETIHDTVANICRGHLSTSSTADSAATNCAALVLQTISTIMNAACRSADPLACAMNLLEGVDGVLGMVCGLVPFANTGAVTQTAPGADICVAKVLGALSESMRIACGSTEGATCAKNITQGLANLAEALDGLVASFCTRDEKSTDVTAHDGAEECLQLLIAESQSVISTLCASRALDECAGLVAQAVTRLAQERPGSILTLADTMKIKLMAVIEEYCFRNELDTACAIGMAEAIRGPLGDAVVSLCPDLHCTAVGREMLEEIIRESCDDPECLQTILVALGCPSGEPPYEATLIPPKIPSYCGIHGMLVQDFGAGAEVPTAVEGVANVVVEATGANRLTIETQEDGTVLVTDAGPEGPPVPGSQTSAEDPPPEEPPPSDTGVGGTLGEIGMNHIGPPACSDEEFDYAGWRVGSTHIWGINTHTIPSYVQYPEMMIAALRHGFYNINHAVTDCRGFTDKVDSASAYYGGHTNARTNITQAGSCSSTHDDLSVTDFVYMRDTKDLFAVCVRWLVNPLEPSHRKHVTTADFRLNTRATWTANPGPHCPENKIDAESASTYARGFTYGLAGLPEATHGNLSMSTGFAFCDESQRTLGKGDIWGLEGIY